MMSNSTDIKSPPVSFISSVWYATENNRYVQLTKKIAL